MHISLIFVEGKIKHLTDESTHAKEARKILDSGFHAMDTGFFVSRTWVSDSNR